MCINFWRYRDAFPDLQSEMFSLPHIGAIILAIAIILVCAFVMRGMYRERVRRMLQILSVVVLALEIFIFLWAYIHGKRHMGAPDYATILPIYTCSLINYTLIGAALGHGFVERCCLAYLTTIGLIAGASGIFLVNGLRSYPFWTLGALFTFLALLIYIPVAAIIVAFDKVLTRWICTK